MTPVLSLHIRDVFLLTDLLGGLRLLESGGDFGDWGACGGLFSLLVAEERGV